MGPSPAQTPGRPRLAGCGSVSTGGPRPARPAAGAQACRAARGGGGGAVLAAVSAALTSRVIAGDVILYFAVPWWKVAAATAAATVAATLAGDWSARRWPRRLTGTELAAVVAVPGVLLSAAAYLGTGHAELTLTVVWLAWCAAWRVWVVDVNPPPAVPCAGSSRARGGLR